MLGILLALAAMAGAEPETPIDAFSYETTEAARAHWAPQSGSRPVRVERLASGESCLAFDASFDREMQRACWDWTTALDLSAGGTVSFEISATRTALGRVFGLYFGTPNGWYSRTWSQTTPEAWTRQSFRLDTFYKEDRPDGWDRITKIRFSVWADTPGEVTYLLRNLRVAPANPAENLLKNGSFEMPGVGVPYGWGCGHWGVGGMPWAADMDLWRKHWAMDHTEARHGSASLRIGNTDGLPLLKARSLWRPLQDGPHVLSAWLKSDRDALPVVLRFAGSSTTVTVGREWTQAVLRGEMPERRRPMAEIAPQEPGTLWLDAVMLQALADPTEEFHPHEEDPAIAALQERIDWSPPRRASEVARGRSVAGPLTPAKTAIDEHGRFLLNGEPYLQHSFGLEFVDDLAVLDAVAAAGFKDICIQIMPRVTTEELRSYFDRCAEVGLRVIPWMHPGVEIERFTRHIEALRGHPALLCWYVYDEPSGDGVAEANAKLERARELDPGRPAFINYLPHDLTGHMGDIYSTDLYPIPHSTPMAAIRAVRTMAEDAASRRAPVWMWLQSTGYAYGIAREPSPRELSCMVYGSLIEGARGIYYFAQMPRTRECFDEMRAMCVEVDALAPVLYSLETAPEVRCGHPAILCRAYALDGVVTVLAVNTGGSAEEVEFALPGGNGALDVVFEDRSIPFANGAWQDTLGPYERRVYRVSGG